MDEDACQTCGSTELTIDEDGRTYCANGHEQARGIVTAEDDQDFARPGNIIRKKEAKGKQKVLRVLRGAKAYQLFLQAWQFILWKQCHALVHQRGMPPELWTIVRDLWTLWLSKLEHRLQDANNSQEATDPTGKEGEATASSGNETDTDPDTNGESKPQMGGSSVQHSPALVDTITLNYLAMLLLRRPIRLAQVLRWIEEEEIPFMRAIRHVPQEMKDRLPGEYHRSLDTIAILGRDDLQSAVYRRAKFYNLTFGMIMPPINQSLFLLNYIRRLALPIEVYTVARRLNMITNYEFCYPDLTTSADSTRRQPTTYPEAQLISLVVTATKLLFPFDSHTIKRYPKDPNDPTTLRMNWSAWVEAKANFDNTASAADSSNSLRPGSEIHVTDNDIFEMTNHQLDQYMDWYQRTWIKGGTSQPGQSQEGGIDKDILDMFPLHELPSQVKTREQIQQAEEEEQIRLSTWIKRVQSSLLPRRAISAEEESDRGLDILRPGARYSRFRNPEDLSRGGKPVTIFHEEAAQTACLSVRALLMAVNRSEVKIELWQRERRRAEVLGEDGEEEAADEDMQGGAAVEEGHDMLVSSPPGTLAMDLGGLEIGQPVAMPDDQDMNIDIDMEMLPEN